MIDDKLEYLELEQKIFNAIKKSKIKEKQQLALHIHIYMKDLRFYNNNETKGGNEFDKYKKYIRKKR